MSLLLFTWGHLCYLLDVTIVIYLGSPLLFTWCHHCYLLGVTFVIYFVSPLSFTWCHLCYLLGVTFVIYLVSVCVCWMNMLKGHFLLRSTVTMKILLWPVSDWKYVSFLSFPGVPGPHHRRIYWVLLRWSSVHRGMGPPQLWLWSDADCGGHRPGQVTLRHRQVWLDWCFFFKRLII